MTISDKFYVPLNFRSYFSLLKGCLSPEEICRYAKEQGYQGIGITDTNNLYGMVRFMAAAESEGIKPVIGVRIIAEGREMFTAYIKNRHGFSLINRLLGNINKERYSAETGKIKNLDEKELVLSFILKNGWQGLVLASDDKDFLESILKKGKKDIFVKLLFNRPYAELLRWAKKKELPVIALNNAVYIKKNARVLYNILRAIDLNITVDNLPIEEQIAEDEAENYIAASANQMRNYFSAVPEALKNANDLFFKVKTDGLLNKSFVFPCFKGLSAEKAYLYLKELCKKGIAERYAKANKDILTRLDYELDIINKKGFSSYFLVVHDIVSRCPRTCGRGSSASSIVSYLLGITHVDPLKYNLFFERFLNLGRKDPPDIDVDFPWDERDKVFLYVFSRYKGQSGMVANHVTFGPRSSIHETAKASGIPEEEIKRIITDLSISM